MQLAGWGLRVEGYAELRITVGMQMTANPSLALAATHPAHTEPQSACMLKARHVCRSGAHACNRGPRDAVVASHSDSWCLEVRADSGRCVLRAQIPRFAFEKFPGAKPVLTTQMKSVGEAMAMGRTFQESFQKVHFWPSHEPACMPHACPPACMRAPCNDRAAAALVRRYQASILDEAISHGLQ